MYKWLNKRFSIWRDDELLVITIEQVVRGFPRYHKYTMGLKVTPISNALRIIKVNHIFTGSSQ